jgi:uncharacterized membrane protein
MAIRNTIRNPVEWGWDQLKLAGGLMGWAGRALHRGQGGKAAAPLALRRIGAADLREALAQGLADFTAYRTDVIFLCVVYPFAGLVLARLAFGYDMLPLLFPLASGFALIGPVAAIGLYEMSRRREQGLAIGWTDAFGVVRSPAFGPILVLGLLLLAIFLIWLAVAYGIYWLTLGPEPPASIGGFLGDVFTTAAGWALIVAGVGVGFCFAVVVLAISVVSFPLLLDREVSLGQAVRTSVQVVRANPGAMALWGLIVAGGLVIGSLPLLVGLVVVMPVLGHATWHLYRRVVA